MITVVVYDLLSESVTSSETKRIKFLFSSSLKIATVSGDHAAKISSEAR
jgi:hypothetical protein